MDFFFVEIHARQSNSNMSEILLVLPIFMRRPHPYIRQDNTPFLWKKLGSVWKKLYSYYYWNLVPYRYFQIWAKIDNFFKSIFSGSSSGIFPLLGPISCSTTRIRIFQRIEDFSHFERVSLLHFWFFVLLVSHCQSNFVQFDVSQVQVRGMP